MHSGSIKRNRKIFKKRKLLESRKISIKKEKEHNNKLKKCQHIIKNVGYIPIKKYYTRTILKLPQVT